MDRTTAFLRKNPAGHTQFLVAKAREGSDTAWSEIYRRYRVMLEVKVRSKIPGFARRRFDAEDVLQSAFSKAWDRIDSFEWDGEGSFRGWLYRLVINEFKNQLRSAERSHVRVDGVHDGGELEQVADREEGLEDSRIELLEQMGKLDEEDHEVISMRSFEGLTWDEIGEVLDCSRDQAQARYQRAIARLQRLLG